MNFSTDLEFGEAMAATTWKEALIDQVDPVLAEEIDTFATQIALRKSGKMDEKVFAELNKCKAVVRHGRIVMVSYSSYNSLRDLPLFTYVCCNFRMIKTKDTLFSF